MPRIIVGGDDAEVVANYPYDNFDPETLPEALVEAVFISHLSDNPGDWGEYDDEAGYTFGLIVNLARRYGRMTGQRPVDVLQALDENLCPASAGPAIDGEYPVHLLNTGDLMAEFTLVEARLVILSDVNGEQEVDGVPQMQGEYAVVEHFFRSNKAYLRADGLSWVEACDWCRDNIEARNSIGA